MNTHWMTIQYPWPCPKETERWVGLNEQSPYSIIIPYMEKYRRYVNFHSFKISAYVGLAWYPKKEGEYTCQFWRVTYFVPEHSHKTTIHEQLNKEYPPTINMSITHLCRPGKCTIRWISKMCGPVRFYNRPNWKLERHLQTTPETYFVIFYRNQNSVVIKILSTASKIIGRELQ